MIQGFIPQHNQINPLVSGSVPSNLVLTPQSPSTQLPSKTKLKRKRFVKDWPNNYNNDNNSFYEDLNNKNESSEDDDDADSNYDSNLADAASDSGSNHSVVSTSSSGNSFVIKANKIKHGHKILVTEEKMTEALKDLQIEIDNIESEPPVSAEKLVPEPPNQDLTFDEDDEETGEKIDKQQNGIYISDELKKKLNELKYRNMMMATSDVLKSGANGLNPFFESPNNMQLVVWAPPAPFPCARSDPDDDESGDEVNTSINSNCSTLPDMSDVCDSTSNFYKVEEPSDSSASKKNRLKRKFSQLNKIQIEEMPPLNSQPLNGQKPAATFYLVDYDEEASTKDDKESTHQPETSKGKEGDSSSVKIVDVSSDVRPFSQNKSEETMDLN
jgi:hypothetical protein